MTKRSSSAPLPKLDTALVRFVRLGIRRWYTANARDLPWRWTRDPYAVWISEVILQQTRVEQGTPYFNRFIAAFPNVHALAAAREGEVLKLWEGLGYYSRARNLQRAARTIVNELRGEFPTNAGDWMKLPGVGRYTASAVASIAYGDRAAVLDGNVIRVLARFLDVHDSVDLPATRNRLWGVAEQLVSPRRPGDFNQGMMELGARVCTPRQPRCDECPLSSRCAARLAGTVTLRPVRAPKKATPYYECVAAVIARRGRYLIVKRPEGGLLGGLWEFPTGRLKRRETHQSALQRECAERLGLRVRARGLLASVPHAYSHFRVTLNVYRCEITGGEILLDGYTDCKWVAASQLRRFAFPKSNHKFLDLLLPSRA